MNVAEIDQAVKDNPNIQFDICIECGLVDEYPTMNEVNQHDFDVICDKCKEESE